ncbi:sigma-54-dependent transcriptional regulator [Candidatus Venteria ishoeyi]|uniref:Transcriptional regulatory protein ZraR n=2 Tax=Candidatus Venteria ishoeyi TaxID=1899563 RepID=A0A1H6FGA1_9GAMM|nr:sigma-54 dependent transcriptional regulator [Candidatus Venteria ishoeyi]SEH08196.1 Transcriptional regulatory protein ZraR [Candidatus Venteria ishoeyi]
MNTPCCLIVDDEPDIRETLSLSLARMVPPVECLTAADLATAQRCLQNREIHLCFTDMKLPDGDGIELVRYIQQQHPHIPVAVITAYGSMETAINALKAGAFDFLSKPVNLKSLRDITSNALKLNLRHNLPDTPMLTGNSQPIQRLKKTIAKLARSQAPAYISGESGTGKELVARLIHSQGARCDNAFIPVNCGAIPSELMESEFFGHKKGSFTGALADKPGLFQAAQGGTLFLDEIADLPLGMQVKLLRAIQEKKVRAVGSQQEIAVDVRILSATHKDLVKLVQEGHFRQDLFYRINVIEVHVPPLRERQDDISTLIEHIFLRLTLQDTNNQENHLPSLSTAAMDALLNYPFPGNVRELENILERAMTLCEDNKIEAEDLQLPEAELYTACVIHSDVEQLTSNEQATGDASLDPLLNNVEKETILKALEQTRWNKTQAAKLLGLTFSTLRYRLKKLQLDKKP